jgi:hypothetical protein
MTTEEYQAFNAQAECEWGAAGPTIAKDFEGVVQRALPVKDLARSGLCSREVELYLQRQLDRLLYEPRLPTGGPDEVRTATRLNRVAGKLVNDSAGRFPAQAPGYLRMLARKYRELEGRYYIFKPCSEQVKSKWQRTLKEARENEEVEARRTAEVVLLGIPEWISDFVVEPLYVLRRVNGTRERVVRIRNVHGEATETLHWPSEQFGSPKPMRIWLNDNSNCANWAAGERELNFLGMDIGQALAGKEVLEVPLRGFHYPSGLWFFEDCALSPTGRVRADKMGVYWYQRKGYLPSAKDPESEEFRQGPRPELKGPLMHPLVEATDAEVRALFQQFSRDLYDACGGYEGWLAIGADLSHGAAKEIFDQYTAFPSLWVFGESGHGKSSVVRWLLRVWGFLTKVGIPLPGSSQAGLRSALQQYGDLPLWVEEYQSRCDASVTDLLKGIYDRGGTIKKTFGEVARVIRSGVIVTGVATSTDSQLRSRYCHVQVSKDKRIKFDHARYLRVDQGSAELYKLGRYVIEHRAEFARLVVDQIGCWISSPELAECDERSRIVHGAAYGAFAAMATLLESHGADELLKFRGYLRAHVERAQVDVREQLYVSRF